jgi:hypothetical protein
MTGLDVIFLLYFITHIPTTILLDSQSGRCSVGASRHGTLHVPYPNAHVQHFHRVQLCPSSTFQRSPRRCCSGTLSKMATTWWGPTRAPSDSHCTPVPTCLPAQDLQLEVLLVPSHAAT